MSSLPSAALAEAIHFAQAHEVPWARNPQAEPLRFGVHLGDPPPYNRLFGPLHARGGVSGVIWQQGLEVAAFGEPARADQTFSVAKTYLALLAGVAQLRGLLPDVDIAIVDALPGIGFDTQQNRPITWRHLLEQTSEWEGTLFGLPDTVDRWRKVASDLRPAGGQKGDARPLQAAGSYWEYNDVRINQLALALLHLFKQPLTDVFEQAIRAPLGCSDAFAWEPYDDAWVMVAGQRMPSVPGGSHWGGGVCISANDQVRIGQLLLDDGLANGQRLLPAGWVQAMSAPCAIAPFFGWLVWRNPDRQNWPGASAESVFMLGAGGHTVWVEPALAVVAVLRWLDPAQAAGAVERLAQALGGG